jgi:ABC-type uncharacterized transport system substrate-binding protein
VKRREFITLFGGAAVWPLSARAQQALPVIGYLNSMSRDGDTPFLAAFHHGLNETGYVEGQNVAIEYRWAEGQYDRLPALAADLVRRQVAVIAATSTPAAIAAKMATSATPIVYTANAPIASSQVFSLNRPSDNATGVNNYLSALGTMRLELLRQLVPNAALIGMLMNSNLPDAESPSREVREAARIAGCQVHVVYASFESDFDRVFATLIQLKAAALLVSTDAQLFSYRDQLVALAARHAIPAIYGMREFVLAGGLMSYSPNIGNGYRQAGIYAGRVLKGARPGDLPLLSPTKFDLAINLQTARLLGLTVPPSLLSVADEVIE